MRVKHNSPQATAERAGRRAQSPPSQRRWGSPHQRNYDLTRLSRVGRCKKGRREGPSGGVGDIIEESGGIVEES